MPLLSNEQGIPSASRVSLSFSCSLKMPGEAIASAEVAGVELGLGAAAGGVGGGL